MRDIFLLCVISNAATKVALTCFMAFKPSYRNLSIFTKPLWIHCTGTRTSQNVGWMQNISTAN